MKETRQCSSCGGICRKSGCERANVYAYQVPIDKYEKALSIAIYYQNRCCDLEEIIEMFCMDAEQKYQTQQYIKPFVLTTPYPQLEGHIA